MNFFKFILPFVILAYTHSALVLGETSLSNCNVLQCATQYDPKLDYFPVKIESTPHYQVEYHNSYKVFYNNLTATSTADIEVYILYKCGTPIPVFPSQANASTPIVLNSTIPLTAKFFSIPLRTIAATETIPLGFLEMLGLRKNIAYMDVSYATSPCARLAASEGIIQDLPYDQTSPAFLAAVAAVDAVLVGNDGSPNPKFISFAITDDEMHVQRIDGLGFLSVFFDREDAAQYLMSNQRTRYYQISDAAKAQNIHPLVAWVTVDAPDMCVSEAPNKIDILTDLGLVPLIVGAPTASPYTICTQNVTVFRQQLLPVDILIDESYFATAPTYEQELNYLGFSLADTRPGSPYKFLVNNAVIRDDGRKSPIGGDDWYEGAIANADAVLGGFAYRVFPHISTFITDPTWQEEHNTTYLWFHNLELNQSTVIVNSTCTNLTAATYPLAALNPAPDAFTCPAWYMDPSKHTQSASRTSMSLAALIATTLVVLLANMMF